MSDLRNLFRRLPVPGPDLVDEVAPESSVLMQDAYEAAQELLDARIRPAHGADVVIASCQEFPTAWVFGYNTRRYLAGGQFLAGIVGGGPVVVPKSGEAPYFGRSATPIEEQLRDLD